VIEVEDENNVEQAKLKAKVGETKKGRPFNILLNQLSLTLGAKGWGRDRGIKSIGADNAKKAEAMATKLLRRADLRYTDYVRDALLNGEDLVCESIAHHWGDDPKDSVEQANSFVASVRDLAEAESSNGGTASSFQNQEEIESQEQEQLRKLQQTVQRLELHMAQLRGALHASGVAPVPEGQPTQGFCADDSAEHEEAMRQSLPGSVPERSAY